MNTFFTVTEGQTFNSVFNFICENLRGGVRQTVKFEHRKGFWNVNQEQCARPWSNTLLVFDVVPWREVHRKNLCLCATSGQNWSHVRGASRYCLRAKVTMCKLFKIWRIWQHLGTGGDCTLPCKILYWHARRSMKFITSTEERNAMH